jgi:hypothetical protein
MLDMLLTLAATLRSALNTRHDLVLENLALRHQVAVLIQSDRRPRFRLSCASETVFVGRIQSLQFRNQRPGDPRRFCGFPRDSRHSASAQRDPPRTHESMRNLDQSRPACKPLANKPARGFRPVRKQAPARHGKSFLH